VLVFYVDTGSNSALIINTELRSLLKADEHVRVLAVSVDDHEKDEAIDRKDCRDGNGSVNYTMLSDPATRLSMPTACMIRLTTESDLTAFRIRQFCDRQKRPRRWPRSSQIIKCARPTLTFELLSNHELRHHNVSNVLVLISVDTAIAFAIAPGGVARAQTTPPKINVKLVLAGQSPTGARGKRVPDTRDPSGYHVNAHDPVSRFALPTKVEVEAPVG